MEKQKNQFFPFVVSPSPHFPKKFPEVQIFFPHKNEQRKKTSIFYF